MNVRVEQMTSTRSGHAVANQCIIYAEEGQYFQSYTTVIAFRPYGGGKIQLDPRWNCSVTTGKYRNEFLGERINDTRRKIASGEYEIVDLNKDN